ncbi:hypothetical protein TrLO_g8072 [Triparma laevis f. longispina]|uniref:EF-hand domain-containing protein n=1 Tax=Triparma laevis f. longispina TaxID=1714387 RepID=A0A9W7A356_9STRA|nr:hypothetical protein TrLO_g8072 [Triparma laevis f. longispina]
MGNGNSLNKPLLRECELFATWKVADLRKLFEFCFELYDFNLNATLSVTEMCMMMQASVCGLLCLTGGTEDDEPSVGDFEKLATEALARADADGSGAVGYEEFVDWARSNVQVMSIIEGLSKVTGEVTIDVADGDSCTEEDPIAPEVEPFTQPLSSRSKLHDAVNRQATGTSIELLESDNEPFKAANEQMLTKVAKSAASTGIPPGEGEEEDEIPSYLELDWIYGYNSTDRNNIAYLTSPEDEKPENEKLGPARFVYPAAARGVVFNKFSNTQSFYSAHTDHILSLQVHPGGTFVASGQRGIKADVHVWNGLTLETAAVLPLHINGVNLLAWNHDGSKLLSVGMNNDHTIALWDWQAKKTLASGVCGETPMLGVAISEDSSSICVVGVKQVLFFAVDGRCLRSKPAALTSKGKRQAFTSVAYIGNDAYVGCASGEVYRFDPVEAKVAEVWQAHGFYEPVLSLSRNLASGGLISGAMDGVCCVWGKGMKMVGTAIDMAEAAAVSPDGDAIPPLDCSILSCCMKGNFVILGMGGGDIFEIKKTDKDGYEHKLISSHSGTTLSCCATHPQELVVATAGSDKTLRVWSIRRKTLVDIRKLPNAGTALAFSPGEGKNLCLGLDNGGCAIFDLYLEVQAAFQHCKEAVTTCKYSPNGKILAVGSADTNIYLYDPAKNYARTGVCRGHTAPVTHMDFTTHSRILQSNDADLNVCFWDEFGDDTEPPVGKKYWGRTSCTVSWQVAGLWPDSEGGEITTINIDPNTDVLAAGDEFGRIRLYNYPCTEGGQLNLTFQGHCGPISRARFSEGGHYLFTTGRDDCCLFQWKHQLTEMDEDDEDKGPVEAIGGRSPAELAKLDPFLLDEMHAAEMLITRSSITPSAEGAVKSWLSMIAEPSGFKFKDEMLASTDCDLVLSWVHGYRAQDCRNSLRYSAAGTVVYNCAALGVVYNKSTDVQAFQQGTHDDDVMSLSMHPDGQLCATGQVGDLPLIVVWDVASQKNKAVLKGFHTDGVSIIKFNSSGKFLLSVGMDSMNSLAVYDWEQSRLVASTVCSKKKIMASCFVGDKILTGGEGFCKFWTMKDGNLTSQTALWEGVSVIDRTNFFCMCAEALDSNVALTSGVSGVLIMWDGIRALNSSHIEKGGFKHETSVNAMYTTNGTSEAVTGDKAGIVALWKYADKKLQLSKVFNMKEVKYDLTSTSVRSVCVADDGTGILIGTGGSEIIEAKLDAIPALSSIDNVEWPKEIDCLCLNEGHCSGETWGLACHPGKDLFCTAGDDKTVMLWETNSRSCVRKRVVDGKVRSLAYSDLGAWNADRPHLAVGMNVGKVIVLDGELENEAVLAELKQPTQWIQEMKYSFEGSRLCVGCHDDHVYVYDVQNAYSFCGKIALKNYATHIDFGLVLKDDEIMNEKSVVVSKESGEKTRNVTIEEIYIQISTPDSLEFFDLKMLSRMPSPLPLKDMTLASLTNNLGFATQGIEENVLSVDRNHLYKKVPVLAASDDMGSIKLYNYPCVNREAAEKTYLAHSSAIQNIRFTYDDGNLVSIGGSDRTICVWKTDIIEEARELDAAGVCDSDTDGSVMGDGSADFDDGDMFGADRGGGDEFMAVKPYLGAIREPSGWKDPDDLGTMPGNSLSIEFVYGSRFSDCRSNMSYGDSVTEIVYNVAGVGVKYDISDGTQLYSLEHDDDIVSCAVDPVTGCTVATGELGKKPAIVLWDSNSGTTLAKMSGFHKRGVNLLTFSADGNLVYSVGMDDDHSVAVYRAGGDGGEVGQLIASGKGSRNKVLGIAAQGENTFALACKNEVKFFTVDVTKGELGSKKGLFGKKAKNKVCVSACYLGPDCVSGQADGSMYLWKGRNASVVKKNHTGAVQSIRPCKDGLVSGGKDGLVIVWSGSLTVLSEIDLSKVDPAAMPIKVDVRSVSSMEDKILVGTASSDIIELDIPTGGAKSILNGHFGGEMWGLDANPIGGNVCAISDDGVLMLWDGKKHKRLGFVDTGGKARGCCYQNDGSAIAVGMYTGNVTVWGGEMPMAQIADVKVAKEWIEAMKYSPDGATLAVGSHDNNIYLLDTKTYTKRGVCKAHCSFITQLDWSADSKHLQSVCGGYELLFWNAKDGKQIKSASDMKDVSWNTFTCKLGWPVQEIWSLGNGGSGSDINCCLKAGGNIILGDDNGLVSMVKYPCLKKASKQKQYKGHSSHVTNAVESDGGGFVWTTGGLDKAVIQWVVK